MKELEKFKSDRGVSLETEWKPSSSNTIVHISGMKINELGIKEQAKKLHIWDGEFFADDLREAISNALP